MGGGEAVFYSVSLSLRLMELTEWGKALKGEEGEKGDEIDCGGRRKSVWICFSRSGKNIFVCFHRKASLRGYVPIFRNLNQQYLPDGFFSFQDRDEAR